MRTAAVFAALLLCLFLAPAQSLIWNGAQAPQWVQAAAPMHEWLAPFLGAEPYRGFGRLVILVYAGFFAGLLYLEAAPGRAGTVLRYIVPGSFAVAAIADVVAYWIAGLGDPALRYRAFWLTEVPMLAICILAIAATGILRLSGRIGARRVNIVLAATPLFAFAATAAVQYMPHGPLIGIGIAALAATIPAAALRAKS